MQDAVLSSGSIWKNIATKSLLYFVLACVAFVLAGCSTAMVPILIFSSDTSVRVGTTLALSAQQMGATVEGGTWTVVGGQVNGTISSDGLYTPPPLVPAADSVTITYQSLGQTASISITVLNPLPSISQFTPGTVVQLNTNVIVSGTGFVSGSQVLVGGIAISTTFIDDTHLAVSVAVSGPSVSSLSLSVANPGPGPASSSTAVLPVAIAPVSISPSATSVRVGTTLALTGMQLGAPLSGGTWTVVGGIANGTVGTDGIYTPPLTVPAPNLVTVTYQALGQTALTSINVLNPTPAITQVQPATIIQLNTDLVIAGTGFVPGSQILVGGLGVPTTRIDGTHLSANLRVSGLTATSVNLAIFNPGPGPITSQTTSVPIEIAPVTISATSSSVRVGSSLALTGMQQGAPLTGGTWTVDGGSGNGSITSDGVYTPPNALPVSDIVTVTYQALEQTARTDITILNPVPAVSSVLPNTLIQINTNATITGSGFVTGSQILIGGSPIATAFVDSSHLSAILVAPDEAKASLALSVSNPAPGPIVSNMTSVPVAIAPIVVSPATSTVRLGSTLALTAMQQGLPLSGGTWSLSGGPLNGSISATGIYTPPSTMPTSTPISVTYQALGQTATATIVVLNATPKIETVFPDAITQFSTSLTVTGSGFVSGSQILVDGAALATQMIDGTHLFATIVVPSNSVTSLNVAVSSPNPGASVSQQVTVPVTLPPMAVSPATLTGGVIALDVSLPGLPANSVVTLDGVPLTTGNIDSSSITASGYLPFWKSGSSVIAVAPTSTGPPFAQLTVPIAPTAVSYDVAARFAMQAGFGPRHDIIEHIQQIGLGPFVDEQLQMSPDVYTDPLAGRRDFLLKTVNNNTQLRLRTAWAFQSFMPGQGIFAQQSVLPWEETLEADAFGNFRKILLDATSDPNLTTLLNLPGNAAPTDPSIHPNQNFARELLQLFSIGTVMLNDDGSIQTDALGNEIPAYGQDTILDISRALTGWTYAQPVNAAYTAFGIDYTQKLIPSEWQHDHGSKLIFGNIAIAAAQTAPQDRDSVLDAVFAHPNVPPFISRRLIQRLVKSQPSPAYISRISKVFEDDGNGVRGNLAAVIKAILLDTEARAGDTNPSSDDGYVQDPLFAEIFAMILMDLSYTDGSASFYPDQFGEPWWFPQTVFAYYSPDYMIPGTSINSPEFQLLTSTLIIQRSQFLWGMINGPQVGFEPWRTTWLNTTFPNLPDFVEALNHLLYHGAMPATERDAILSYCQTLPTQQMQLNSALFLALNGDTATVVR